MSLRDAQRDVRAFHEATGSTIGDTIGLRDTWLRANLIAEEAAETISALGYEVEMRLCPGPIHAHKGSVKDIAHVKLPKADIPDAIDGLCDLIYVTLGTAVTMGVDLTPFWEEVQRANMSKATGPKREDGKQLKPEGWQSPNIEGILGEMVWSEVYDKPDPLGWEEIWKDAV